MGGYRTMRQVRRVLAGILAALLALSLAACGKHDDSPVQDNTAASSGDSAQASKDTEKGSDGALEVDEGLFDVKITLPASMIEDFKMNVDNLEETSGGKATKNDDGSVTLTMSKADHKKMMDEMHESALKTFDEMTAGKEKGYESIKSVEANADLSVVTLTVTQDKFENSMDSFGLLNVYIQSMFYQLFDGKDSDSIKTKIDLVDEATGQVYKSVNYPDDMKTSGS